MKSILVVLVLVAVVSAEWLDYYENVGVQIGAYGGNALIKYDSASFPLPDMIYAVQFRAEPDTYNAHILGPDTLLLEETFLTITGPAGSKWITWELSGGMSVPSGGFFILITSQNDGCLCWDSMQEPPAHSYTGYGVVYYEAPGDFLVAVSDELLAIAPTTWGAIKAQF